MSKSRTVSSSTKWTSDWMTRIYRLKYSGTSFGRPLHQAATPLNGRLPFTTRNLLSWPTTVRKIYHFIEAVTFLLRLNFCKELVVAQRKFYCIENNRSLVSFIKINPNNNDFYAQSQTLMSIFLTTCIGQWYRNTIRLRIIHYDVTMFTSRGNETSPTSVKN